MTQLAPLIAGSLFGGSVVDAVDRRRLLMLAQLLMAACSAGLAVNADLGTSLWPLFVLPALTAGFSGLDSAGRNAIVPNLVRRSEVATANAMFQALFQLGQVAGPAMAGLLLAGSGVRFVYWIDVASFGAALLFLLPISPQPPTGAAGHRPGLRSIMEGLSFVRGRQAIQGAYLIDINAMVFGMPRALFPAIGLNWFHGGAGTVGLLAAAVPIGALLGAATSGWATHVRRQGRAVLLSVCVWGGSIALFGVTRILWLALILLAIAGAADMVSAIFRNTILQVSTPDALRGRLQGVFIVVVTGGPRIGDFESGAVANAFGLTASVISGGLACLAGVGLLAARYRSFAGYDARDPRP
jgi:MFS family permease